MNKEVNRSNYTNKKIPSCKFRQLANAACSVLKVHSCKKLFLVVAIMANVADYPPVDFCLCLRVVNQPSLEMETS